MAGRLCTRLLALTVLATSTVACGENQKSIYREYSLDAKTTVVTDAKQRVILNIPNLRTDKTATTPDGRPVTSRVVCAEPSPDIAQALSEAFRLGGSVDLAAPGAVGTATQKIGLDLARSSSASIAQLGERLATIQLLRDKMYRACEAYANGAVEKTGYTLMLARLDKTMVTLLSNEMAAGAFGRALAQLGSSASAGGVNVEALRAAEAKVAEKSKALMDLAKKPAPPNDPEKSAHENSLAGAQRDLEKATVELLALDRAVAGSASGGIMAASAAGLGTINGRSNGSVAESIAAIHRHYIDDDGIEPLVDACITAMDSVKLRDEKSSATTSSNKEETERLANRIVDRFVDQGAAEDPDRIRLRDLEDSLAQIQRYLRASELREESVQRDLESLRRLEKRNPAEENELRYLSLERSKRASDIAEAKARMESLQKAIADQNQLITDKKSRDREKGTLSSRIVEAFLLSGSAFSAFCYENVLSKTAPYMIARSGAKQELRKLNVMESGADPISITCAAVLSNGDMLAALAQDKLPSAGKELVNSCVGRINGSTKEVEKPMPVKVGIEAKAN